MRGSFTGVVERLVMTDFFPLLLIQLLPSITARGGHDRFGLQMIGPICLQKPLLDGMGLINLCVK